MVSGGTATLANPLFGGTLSITGGELILTGNAPFVASTTISAGATLALGNGGAAGSVSGTIAGPITDNGALLFNRNNTGTEAGLISGAGVLDVIAGDLVLPTANTYSGGSTISSGATVTVGNSAALGTGPVVISGGTLLADASMTLANVLTVNGPGAAFAAVAGTTLTLNSGAAWTLNSAGVLDFGGGTNTGTVVLVAGVPVETGAEPNVDVLIGTLQNGSNFLNRIEGGTLTVASGALFDLHGFGTLINVLSAPSHITNTGASTDLQVLDLTGTIDGPITSR